MIEELEILKTIIGDLSNVGMNGVIAYIAYKLVKLLIIVGAFCYAVQKTYQYFINPDHSEHVKKLNKQVLSLEKDKDVLSHKHKMEIEDMKHMYKILKEAKE